MLQNLKIYFGKHCSQNELLLTLRIKCQPLKGKSICNIQISTNHLRKKDVFMQLNVRIFNN